MIFSSGVLLYLNVNSAAALVFDEGGQSLSFRSNFITQSEVLSSPHKKVLAASKS